MRSDRGAGRYRYDETNIIITRPTVLYCTPAIWRCHGVCACAYTERSAKKLSCTLDCGSYRGVFVTRIFEHRLLVMRHNARVYSTFNIFAYTRRERRRGWGAPCNTITCVCSPWFLEQGVKNRTRQDPLLSHAI